MRHEVTLHVEQRATVIVEADPEASRDDLTRLALLELDKSGGTEWITEIAWTESSEADPEEAGS